MRLYWQQHIAIIITLTIIDINEHKLLISLRYTIDSNKRISCLSRIKAVFFNYK